jgi:hypothetical protein
MRGALYMGAAVSARGRPRNPRQIKEAREKKSKKKPTLFGFPLPIGKRAAPQERLPPGRQSIANPRAPRFVSPAITPSFGYARSYLPVPQKRFPQAGIERPGYGGLPLAREGSLGMRQLRSQKEAYQREAYQREAYQRQAYERAMAAQRSQAQRQAQATQRAKPKESFLKREAKIWLGDWA